MKTRKKQLSCLLLAVILLCCAMPAVFASGIHIRTNLPEAAQITQGEQYTLMLADVFTDSDGHALTYTVTGDDENRATTRLSDGVYYFTSASIGTYTPTITASCGSDSASVQLQITVKAGAISDVDQYGYNETPAEAVTVYATVSSDGVPLIGNDADSTVLSHLEVTVPYFDLERYDLENFYRYATENGQGGYIGDTVIERPTAMHLFIYLLERYYLGLPESDCGTGASVSELFGTCRDDEVFNMFGETAYEAWCAPLEYTGGATSTYMHNFWGHDENLMYYRNHRYPLMSPGWGSTSDYILLSDGDAIDLAMFTNWNFYTHGAFCCTGEADSTRPTEHLSVVQGETLSFTGLKYGTQSVAEGGTDGFVPLTADDGVYYVCYDADWENTEVQPEAAFEMGEGRYILDTAELAPGLYHLVGFDPNCGTNEACMAPATVTLCVQARGDINGNGIQDNEDLTILLRHVAGIKWFTSEQEQIADIDNNGTVDAADITALAQMLGGRNNENAAIRR